MAGKRLEYERRYNDSGRLLCRSENNTCNNLASCKGIVYGKRYYHTKCEKHRRKFHDKAHLSKIPLKNWVCEDCGLHPAVQRHRLIKDLGYVADNIRKVCIFCHSLYHLPVIIR